MRKNIFLTIIILFAIATYPIAAQELQRCWKKQGVTLSKRSISFNFTENRIFTVHDSIPFGADVYTANGSIYLNDRKFFKEDTLTVSPGSLLYSRQFITPDESYSLNYGDSICIRYGNRQEKYESQLIEASKYSPVPILQYFLLHKKELRHRLSEGFVVYELKTTNTVISISIDKETYLLSKVSFLQDDPMFGDNNTIIEYRNYEEFQNSIYVSKYSSISRYNGRIKESVSMLNMTLSFDRFKLLPECHFSEVDEKDKKDVSVKIYNYNNHLHFVNLEHEYSRALLVEFKDFFVAIEAPNTSANGDLIISEAKKIAPEKIIKYFLFSHYHPSHLGGFRAFVHNGATVVSTMDNFDLISYISKNKRTLNPDSLQMKPKRLNIEIMDRQKVITDGDYEMEIYVIGEKSMHTKDYAVFYFPAEKLLFEGDLIHLPEYYAHSDASNSEKGLFDAIKKTLNLDVDVIVQSNYENSDCSTFAIPYSEFEKFVSGMER